MIQGLGTALVTPFTGNGAVDYEGMTRLLDIQLQGKVDFLVVLGTTGEAATLHPQERREVRRFIARYIDSRIPLVLGFGGNNTAQIVADLQVEAKELQEDYAAILSVCPYYNKPNQEGLYQHFCAIAEASPIPVILYNVPGRTGVNLLPETVMRIYNAHPDKIIGIKEASGNLDQIKRLIILTGEAGLTAKRSNNKAAQQRSSLLVFSGDDGIACEVMEAGGDGLISVASNAFPDDFRKIVHDCDAALQTKYAELIKLLFAEGNPVGIKAVLAQQGIIGNYLRLPLVPATQELQAKITRFLSA